MQKLLSYLSSVHPLSPELREHLLSILQTREVKRKEILLNIGQVCRYIYFVESGLFRCYYLNGAKETCSWFMKEGDTMTSVGSFYSQRPSYECIQALEPSVVHYISFDQLQWIYEVYPSFNTNGRKLTEKYYQLSDERNYILKMSRVADRYQYLREHHAELERRVPRGDLASYLGIREWTLSRMGRG